MTEWHPFGTHLNEFLHRFWDEPDRVNTEGEEEEEEGGTSTMLFPFQPSPYESRPSSFTYVSLERQGVQEDGERRERKRRTERKWGDWTGEGIVHGVAEDDSEMEGCRVGGLEREGFD